MTHCFCEKKKNTQDMGCSHFPPYAYDWSVVRQNMNSKWHVYFNGKIIKIILHFQDFFINDFFSCYNLSGIVD